jgi:hypothetical protein
VRKSLSTFAPPPTNFAIFIYLAKTPSPLARSRVGRGMGQFPARCNQTTGCVSRFAGLSCACCRPSPAQRTQKRTQRTFRNRRATNVPHRALPGFALPIRPPLLRLDVNPFKRHVPDPTTGQLEPSNYPARLITYELHVSDGIPGHIRVLLDRLQRYHSARIAKGQPAVATRRARPPREPSPQHGREAPVAVA